MANNLGSLLDEAKRTITGERQDQYGAPEDSFDRIAAYWTTYLGRPVSALDVAHLMALMKLARAQGQGFKRDTYVDLAGYAAIAADRLAPKPKSSGKGWEYCPSCGGVLDTGWECLSCKADWRGFAAFHPGIEPAPKPAPEPERSCGTCLHERADSDELCEFCHDYSEWTEG